MSGLLEGLILLAVTAVGVVFWWGIKGLIRTLQEISTRLSSIDIHLTTLSGRMEKAEQWQEMHSDEDQRRFIQLETALRLGGHHDLAH